MPTEHYGSKTLKAILQLHQQGIEHISVIMRHSERHYDPDNPVREPFMSLTETGKDLALKFGDQLPSDKVVRAYSSFIGRCIETAYLIDKGHVSKGGDTRTNAVELYLSPFYAGNPGEILKTFLEAGSSNFLRAWIDGEYSSEIIDNPKDSACKIIDFAKATLENTTEDHIDVLITHDWNLYLVKEVFLGLRHEEAGNVEYLEGVVLYKENEDFFIANHQAAPRIVDV